jgi:peroxiredoxin
MANVGDKAPNFELQDQDQKTVTLGDYKGKKLLIAFYPFAFSPVCADEFTCFREDLSQFQGKGVEVVGISVDSPWSNQAFADSLGVKYPLLSDFGKKASADYGVLRQEGFADRAYILVDEEGTVKYRHVMDSPGNRLDNAELIKAIG